MGPRTSGELHEVQFDGLPGPTHGFAGLAHGNLASTASAGAVSDPRAAARQCLAKMRAVLDLGVPVALAPPLDRPDLAFLRACGWRGNDRSLVLQAEADDARLLRWAQSSAAMWTANAATVAPGVDGDGTTRLVPANLVTTPHRALEARPRTAMLRALFARCPDVVVEEPLPPLAALGDEGAANHARLTTGEHGTAGVHLFVHGRAAALPAERLPQRFPARQTLEASRAVARLLRLPAPRALHARQHPEAIDAGAFHNDVVMVADRERVLIHERALDQQERVLAGLAAVVPGLRVRVVAERELPLADAVRSYLFNAQLLGTPRGRVLVAPLQAADGAAGAVSRALVEEGFVDDVRFLDLRESMANGGGPACLRLRLPLAAPQAAALPTRLDTALIGRLEDWVDRHYRDRLAGTDLADPDLIDEGRRALDALTALFGLGSLYAFQGGPC